MKSLQRKDFLSYSFLTNMLKIKDVGENEASCGGTGPKGSGRPGRVASFVLRTSFRSDTQRDVSIILLLISNISSVCNHTLIIFFNRIRSLKV